MASLITIGNGASKKIQAYVGCKHNGRHKKKKVKDFSCWYFAEYSKTI